VSLADLGSCRLAKPGAELIPSRRTANASGRLPAELFRSGPRSVRTSDSRTTLAQGQRVASCMCVADLTTSFQAWCFRADVTQAATAATSALFTLTAAGCNGDGNESFATVHVDVTLGWTGVWSDRRAWSWQQGWRYFLTFMLN